MQDHHASRSRRWPPTLAALATLILIAAACNSNNPPASQGGESQGGGGGTTVTMSGSSFGVAEITVPVGDVTFVNDDGVTHIVAEGENASEAASPRITKATIAGGAKADIAFDAAGDYHITCLIHGSMNMVVHVE